VQHDLAGLRGERPHQAIGSGIQSRLPCLGARLLPCRQQNEGSISSKSKAHIGSIILPITRLWRTAR